jgi:hypothetical protein
MEDGRRNELKSIVKRLGAQVALEATAEALLELSKARRAVGDRHIADLVGQQARRVEDCIYSRVPFQLEPVSVADLQDRIGSVELVPKGK